jgi:hypothetical protein
MSWPAMWCLSWSAQVQDVYTNSDVPVQVVGLSGVTQIAAGAEFGRPR